MPGLRGVPLAQTRPPNPDQHAPFTPDPETFAALSSSALPEVG